MVRFVAALFFCFLQIRVCFGRERSKLHKRGGLQGKKIKRHVCAPPPYLAEREKNGALFCRTTAVACIWHASISLGNPYCMYI